MAKQTFQVGIDFIANVNDLQSKIKTVTGDIAKMGSTSGGSQVQKHFDKLTQSVQNLQTKAQQPITSQAEFNKLTSELNKAESEYNNLIASVERMRNISAGQKISILSENEQNKIQKAAQALKLYEQEEKKAAQSAKQLEGATIRAVQAQNKAGAAKSTWKALEKEYETSKAKLDQLRAASLAVSSAQSKLDDAIAAGAGEKEIAQLKLQLEQAKGAAQNLGVVFQEGVSPIESMKAAVTNLNNETNKLATRKTNLKQDYEEAKRSATELKNQVTTLEQQLGKTGSNVELEQAFERLKAKAKELGIDVRQIKDSGQIDELKNKLIQLESQGLERADREIDEVANSLRGELKNGLNQARQGLDQASQSFNRFNTQAQEVEQLKSQLGYFFSLTNSVYLFRAALQSAFETVKELDAVMTETAVVTDFSVADMWERLPEYSAAASDLGSSIKDVYAATTLYYQQGLKTEAAMTVGIETMKMARIAGMEAEEATQAMTAALRGFNMTVNETNALRINDVYSNLAAITAADTEQIATAMTKTASIAASANMEFETTAALLAQIIETTQEAPETAGTALKTIIARFSEVKELQNKGMSTGEDSEGESIDVNKIDKALKTVGISMDGFFAGTEGLDSVLMRLAEKWDTLDFTTQRYIATMAAGSRQQSRFIAMMSDYERTTQLVSAANTSAGASQKQFSKTMESLEAKLNRLKVAWDEFTMNIADDELIKFGIDLLTGILNVINKLTGALPGLIGSFANLALVFVALRAGGALLTKALNGISGALAGGIINKATEAGIIAKSAETGAKAGTAATQGAAAAINSPTSQVALAKSYNLLFWKVKTSLPLVTFELAPNAIPNAKNLEIQLAKIRAAKAECATQDSYYISLQKAEADILARLNGQYTLNGALLQGLSEEQRKAIAQKVLEGGITTQQIAAMNNETLARYAAAVATGDEATALAILNALKLGEGTVTKGKLYTFFEEIGLRVLNKQAIDAEKISLWQLIAAKMAALKTWIANNAAMLTGLLLIVAIVAAIVLLVSGISKLIETWKGMKDGTLELEKINKMLEEVTEQTNAASEAMNDLAEQKTGLEDLTTQLGELTKGTTEWKQKLTEVNMQVLELLNKYPELAGYVIRGENGELRISNEGWEYAQNAAFERYNLLTQTSIGLQTQKTAVQQEIDFEAAQSDWMQKKINYEEMRNSEEGKRAFGFGFGGLGLAGGAIGGGALGAKMGTAIGTAIAPGIGTAVGVVLGGLIGLGAGYLIGSEGFSRIGQSEESIQREATGGLTEKEFTEFAAAAAEKGLTHENTKELQALYKQMGYESITPWLNVNTKIQQLGFNFDELANSSLQLELAQKTYVDSFMNSALNGAGLEGHKQANQISEVQAEVFEDLDERIEKEVENMDKGLSDDMKQQYATLTGQTLDQINAQLKDESLSEETIKQTIATNTVQKQIQKAMKATAKELNRLTTAGKDVTSLFNILSTQGKDIKLQDITDFKNAQANTDLEGKELSDITDLDQQKKAVENYLAYKDTSLTAIGLTGEDDWQIIWKNLNMGAESFVEATATAGRLGSTISDKVSASAAKGLTEKIEEQLGQGSKNGGEILNWVAQIIESNNLTAEQAEILYDTLGSINWDDRGQLEDLVNKLEQNGLDVSAFNDDITSFKQSVIEFADAVYNFTPDQKAEIIQNANDLISDILKGEKTSYTAEEVANFSQETQKEFIRIGNFWYYTGSKSKSQLAQDVMETAGIKTSVEKIDNAIIELNNLKASSTGIKATQTESGQIKQNVVKGAKESSLGYIFNNDKYKKQTGIATSEYFDVTSDLGRYWTGAGWGQRYNMDPYVATLQAIQQYVASGSIIIPGLNSNASIGEIESWYMGQTDEQKEFTASMAVGYVSSQLHSNDSLVDNYFLPVHNAIGSGDLGWFDATKTENHIEGSDWDIIEKLANGELKTTATGEVGEQIVDPTQLREMAKKYIPDLDIGSMRLDEIAYALINHAQSKKAEVDAISETDYSQWFATMDISQVQEFAAEDNELFATRTEAAKKYIEAVLNSYDGAKAQAEALLNANQDIVKTYEDGETAIKAIVAANVQQEQKLKSFTQAVKDNIENLKKGESAGEDFWKAMENISDSIESAFGIKVSQNTIQKWIPYLSDMTEGGEKAAAAYKAMAKEIMNVELLKGLTFDPAQAKGQEEAYKAFVKYITENPIDPNDVMDLNQLYESIGIAGTYWDWLTGVIESNPIYGTVTVSTELDGTTKKLFQLSDFSSVVGNYFSGGGGGGSSSKWENPYDEFYNSVQKINEELRKREKLELRYQRLLDRNAATAKELASLKQAQLSSLRTEREDRTQLLGARKAQMQSIMDQYSDVGKYASYDFKTGQISIDWASLEALEGSTNEKLTSRIEDFIGKLEEQKDMIQEEEDALDDIEDAVWEIYDQGKDEYFGFEDRVKEALIDERQKEIDKLSDINDSINDTNSKLLDSMQQQIDAYRQTRDNEKTEQEISDKQRRLSYLSQDTSGANALEIKQLQKEIDEAQEDYTDTLIDQKISELQQQNDQAAEQRQQQIDLQQAMLDQYVDSGEIWKEVQSIISEGVDAEKKLMPGSRLESLLQSTDGFEGLSHLKKMAWLNELENDLATSLAWLESGAMQSLYGMGASVTFKNADGKMVTGTINKDGDVLTKDSAYSAGSFKIDAATGQITSSESTEQAKANYEKASKVTSNQPVTNVYNTYNSGGGGGTYYIPDDKVVPETDPTTKQIHASDSKGNKLKYYAFNTGSDDKVFKGNLYRPLLLSGKETGYWVKWSEFANITSKEPIENGKRYKHTITNNIAGFKAYQFKTGGLADFTGPAWLDGTKSKPEYILNADQTKAFFTLVDVLSGLTNSAPKSTEKTGDNIYDIDINVESISNDYDVEQIAGTIKRLIIEDAKYRNNNAVNLMR